MRTALAALALISLTACATKHNDAGVALAASTSKSPQDYAACLAPKWQAFVPTATSVQTGTGWTISAPAQFTEEKAIATADVDGAATKVSVWLPTEWAGTTAWTNMARACL